LAALVIVTFVFYSVHLLKQITRRMNPSFLILLVFCAVFTWAGSPVDLDGFLPGPGGGLLHPDCHVVLPEGARMVDHDTLELIDGSTQLVPPCNISSSRESQSLRGNKREVNGWNVYSRYFMNAYIDVFNGDWVVPNNPAGGYKGQLLYYFTGLEDASCNCILQPVVWYGVSPAGGGDAWYAAVWYVFNNNANYITSPVVQVAPGAYISTYMQRTPSVGWECGMSSKGVGITSGTFPDILQSNAYCTLEVYNVADCTSFPFYQATTFQNLVLYQTGVGNVGFNNAFWNIYVSQTDCTQSMSCNGNICTMYYGAGVPCPSNAGSALGTNSALNSAGINTIVSPGCYYRLILQVDGNIVLYTAYNQIVWNSVTSGRGSAPFQLVMQGDGNLVLYDARGAAIWFTGTHGTNPYLNLQTDGNLVIYSTAGALWATNT